MPFRFLFYVEPLTELERPLFHSAWLEFAAKFTATVARSGVKISRDTFRLVTNSVMADEGKKYGFGDDIVDVIEEARLLENYQTNYLDIMVKGYRGELAPDQLRSAADLIHEATGEFEPDIVVTFTTAPHLELAFPDALILHMEYGLYSRAPFPESFYLDPFGKFSNSALGKFNDLLNEHEATRDELRFVEKFREYFVDGILVEKSPYKMLEANLREKFEKLVLLPLQFSGHYGFNGTCAYESQLELLSDFLDHTPNDIGVIALPHSTAVHIGDIIESEALDELIKRFPNLLINPELSKVLYPSQFMLAHVDGVASVSSSVALQGMLWGSTIIALGDSHVNAIADGIGPASAADIPVSINREKNTSKLAWLMSHYYIPGGYLYEPSWLTPYLSKCLKNWREGKRELDFFERIDVPSSMLEFVKSGAVSNVPIWVKESS